ncbi:MAG: hypothetical protein GPJ22_22335 [Microcystis aeruginosa LL13-03]|jgi:hypothetical protein|nr:hypothetical protein [Microcystis aeruginosa LL13-03]NCR69300.1 hypothetical protein [Microcystis aeruginosa LL11-07]NCR91937.1 hypothetical protein [Microcystis aeruginosa G13-10]NCS04814.1 hypothetical protein [Microcystis aeruginosa G13-11]NCS08488.1 hypothetical protein [Microcystis aeruginosa G13-07]NCS37131.1 hypothetical protein [Microcystis aeruginosa G11-01]NCS41792.1 hypothetical protein [Microcystis aeruginosa BS13-10]NCS50630.1 hypothetical protein [Microcystis aeruginosa BK11
MTQVTLRSQTIIEKLHSLTPQQQQAVIDFIEFLQFQADKKEISLEEEPISAYEAAQDLAGCIESGIGDLSYNKKYLESPARK